MSREQEGPYASPLGSLPARDLLDDVAKGNMAPGGIGMAALMGAIAAVLAAMIGRLTAGKPGYEPMTEEMERLAERAKVLEDQLLNCMDQEVAAFNKLVESMGLPRGNTDGDELSTMRRDCIRIAARGYAQVPLQVGQIAMEVLTLAETAIRYGNRELLADAGTGWLAAVAAAKSACLQVLINLRGQEGDEWVVEAREKVDKWLETLPALEAELWQLLLQQVS